VDPPVAFTDEARPIGEGIHDKARTAVELALPSSRRVGPPSEHQLDNN
jgi:hypothetical protein